MDLKLAQRRRRVGGARPPRPRSSTEHWPSGAVTWVKVVIGPDTDPDEFDAAIAMVAAAVRRRGDAHRGLPPAPHPVRRGDEAPTPQQVLELQERALRIHPRVRVVPQTHKAIGQL